MDATSEAHHSKYKQRVQADITEHIDLQSKHTVCKASAHASAVRRARGSVTRTSAMDATTSGMSPPDIGIY